MPFSMKQGKNLIIDWLKKHKNDFSNVVDFGCGAGWYGTTIRSINPSAHLTGIEIWQPYLEKYKLAGIYDQVIIDDARTLPFESIDLAIFGDVLEHMEKDEAKALFERIKAISKYIIVSIPAVEMPQGPVFGNKFESHLATWNWEELCDYFADFEIKEQFLQIGVFINKA